MYLKIKNERTHFALAAGTVLLLGQEQVVLTENAEVSVEGGRSKDQIAELIAGAGQITVNQGLLKHTEDGVVVTYTHRGSRSESVTEAAMPPVREPVTKAGTLARSASSGEFVSEEEAAAKPEKTVVEKRKRTPRGK